MIKRITFIHTAQNEDNEKQAKDWMNDSKNSHFDHNRIHFMPVAIVEHFRLEKGKHSEGNEPRR